MMIINRLFPGQSKEARMSVCKITVTGDCQWPLELFLSYVYCVKLSHQSLSVKSNGKG